MPASRRPRTSPREERRRELTAELLAIVERHLASGEPYADISVERLITAAGISRSTFYVYYEDKGSLLLALAADVVQQLVVAAERSWTLPTDATHADVERTMLGILETYRSHAPIWAALVDAASYDARVRTSFRAIVDGAAGALAAHIRAGQETGSVRAAVDPDRTAAWLTWMTERGCYQLLPGASDAELRDLGHAWTDIVWWALYEAAPARR